VPEALAGLEEGSLLRGDAGVDETGMSSSSSLDSEDEDALALTLVLVRSCAEAVDALAVRLERFAGLFVVALRGRVYMSSSLQPISASTCALKLSASPCVCVEEVTKTVGDVSRVVRPQACELLGGRRTLEPTS
jgi:hypothetical protein